MRKLTLNLEQLHVDSFRPANDAYGLRGTVDGHSDESGAPGCWTTGETGAPGCYTYPGAASCAEATVCCYATQGWCNQSQGGAQHTLCDMSCERPCR